MNKIEELRENIERNMSDISRLSFNFLVSIRRIDGDYYKQDELDELDIIEYVGTLTFDDFKEDVSKKYIDILSNEEFHGIAEELLLEKDEFDCNTYRFKEHLLATYKEYVYRDIIKDKDKLNKIISDTNEIEELKEGIENVVNDLREKLDEIKDSIMDIEYIDDIEDYCDVSRYDLEDLCDRVEEYIEGLVDEVEENNE